MRMTGAFGRVFVAGLLSFQACTTVVVPPVAPNQPRPVFLLDHGRHASLAVPREDGGIVRYSYGDWRYYAQVRTGLFRGSAAILWPTRAALGRRELPGPLEAAAVRRNVRVWSEQVYELMVDSLAVEGLRSELDSIYDANLDTRIYNSAYDLEFVQHPRAYWVFHNSNQVVAGWLKELGCQVRGLALFSKWKVRPPSERVVAATESDPAERLRHGWARIWIGHVHDVTGDRDRALAFYRSVLDSEGTSGPLQMAQYNIGPVTAKEWARQRIGVPFSRRD